VLDAYCGKALGEMLNSDPRIIKERTEGLNDTLKFKNEQRYYYLLDLIEEQGWIDSEGTSPHHLLSPLMFHLSSHMAFQDHCKEHHPNINPVKCALTYAYQRKYQEYDEIMKNRPADREVPLYLQSMEDQIKYAQDNGAYGKGGSMYEEENEPVSDDFGPKSPTEEL